MPSKKKSRAKTVSKRRARDAEREDRIAMEIVVDAYDAGERAMGWYYYLDERLALPLKVRCVAERSISPLAVGDQTTIVSMAAEDECGHEMFVEVPWGKRTLAVPLAQLELLAGADAGSVEAIGDWHYWIAQGYTFG